MLPCPALGGQVKFLGDFLPPLFFPVKISICLKAAAGADSDLIPQQPGPDLLQMSASVSSAQPHSSPEQYKGTGIHLPSSPA